MMMTMPISTGTASSGRPRAKYRARSSTPCGTNASSKMYWDEVTRGLSPAASGAPGTRRTGPQGRRRATRSALEPDHRRDRPRRRRALEKLTTSAATSRTTGPSSAPSSEESSTSGSARPTISSSTTPSTGSTPFCRTPDRRTKARSRTGPGQDTAGWESRRLR